MSTQQVDQILRDAYDWLAEDPRRWCRKDLWRDEDGGMEVSFAAVHAVKQTCLGGAITRACYQHNLEEDVEFIATQRLAHEIAGSYNTMVLYDPLAVVAALNDDEHTTFEDALLHLKRAIN